MTVPEEMATELANKKAEREALRGVIQQWNANRLDLFELSEPNEDLEFHGVMRFYFQDSGQKVATKCIRVASDATTQAVIETLIEKFRPDMRMLSVPEYALYEIHENGEERKLGLEEKPLLVQLNWHIDDREGRFLLRRIDDKTNAQGVGFGNSDGSSFRRKLSKREKKQMKKQEKLSRLKSLEQDENTAPVDQNGVAEKLYTELPETSFTRSISNPEAVMRRRRQQKLERKLQQFRSKDGGPDTGGTLKIYGEALCKDVPYKTLLLSVRDTAVQVVREMLSKYGLEKVDPQQYCLVQVNGEGVSGSAQQEYILDDDECPLAILMNHPSARGSIMFHVRRRPADYVPRKRKKKPAGKWNELDHRYEDERLPFLLELNPDGSDIPNGAGARHRLQPNVTEVGSERPVGPQAVQAQTLTLSGPTVMPRHCVIAFTENIVTLTPCSRDAHTYVNNQRIHQTTILQNGAIVKFGRLHTFRFIDPAPEDRIRQRHDSGRQIEYAYDRRSPDTTSQEASADRYGSTTSNDVPSQGQSGQASHPSSPSKSGVLRRARSPSNSGLVTEPTHNYETTFDLDGNVETASLSSSNRPDGNRLSQADRQPRGTDPILPAVLEFLEETEEAFLHAVISDVEPSAPQFKLAPTYTLYLAARYRASTHYRPELQPTERAHKLTVMLANVATMIQRVIQERYMDTSSLALWLANGSELLHMLKSDRHVGAFSTRAQDILAEAVHTAFASLVRCVSLELAPAMSQFMADADEPAKEAGVLQIFSNTMALLRRCRVNAALTIQLFSHLFHVINATAFNALVSNGNLCVRWFGRRLKARLNALETWAERQGLELASQCHLATIMQATHLLQAPKYNAEELATLSSTCFKLNSLQVRALLQKYQPAADEPRLPAELIENVVRVAESVADTLARADGREIRLEEEPTLNLALLLPEDGYTCEVIRGVPPGLAEFLAPLQRDGLCRMAPQPTSSGYWTIYMIDHQSNLRSPSAMSNRSGGYSYHPGASNPPQPEIQVIKLHKSTNGMGLSIVAAKGAGQDRLGIYIKSVVAGGAADADGRLTAGDQLLKVDGQSLVGITQEKAAEYLVRTGPIVTLEVAKQGAIYHGLATLLSQPSPVMTRVHKVRPKSEHFQVPKVDEASGQPSTSHSMGNLLSMPRHVIPQEYLTEVVDPLSRPPGADFSRFYDVPGERVFYYNEPRYHTYGGTRSVRQVAEPIAPALRSSTLSTSTAYYYPNSSVSMPLSKRDCRIRPPTPINVPVIRRPSVTVSLSLPNPSSMAAYAADPSFDLIAKPDRYGSVSLDSIPYIDQGDEDHIIEPADGKNTNANDETSVNRDPLSKMSIPQISISSELCDEPHNDDEDDYDDDDRIPHDMISTDLSTTWESRAEENQSHKQDESNVDMSSDKGTEEGVETMDEDSKESGHLSDETDSDSEKSRLKISTPKMHTVMPELNLDLTGLESDVSSEVSNVVEKCWKSPEEVRLGCGRVAALAKHFSKLTASGLTTGSIKISGKRRFASVPDVSPSKDSSNDPDARSFRNKQYNSEGDLRDVDTKHSRLSLEEQREIIEQLEEFSNLDNIDAPLYMPRRQKKDNGDLAKASQTDEITESKVTRKPSRRHKKLVVEVRTCLPHQTSEIKINESVEKRKVEKVPSKDVLTKRVSKSNPCLINKEQAASLQERAASLPDHLDRHVKHIVKLKHSMDSCDKRSNKRMYNGKQRGLSRSCENIKPSASQKECRGIARAGSSVTFDHNISLIRCHNSQLAETLVDEFLDKELKSAADRKILRHIGLSRDSAKVVDAKLKLDEEKENNVLVVVLVAAGGSREDIINAEKKLMNIRRHSCRDLDSRETSRTTRHSEDRSSRESSSPRSGSSLRPRRMSERDLPSRLGRDATPQQQIHSSKSVPALHDVGTESKQQHEVFNPGYSRASSSNSVTPPVQPPPMPTINGATSLRSRSSHNLHDPTRMGTLPPTGLVSRQQSSPNLNPTQSSTISGPSVLQSNEAERFYQNLSVYRNQDPMVGRPSPSQQPDDRSPLQMQKSSRGSQNSLNRPGAFETSQQRDRPISAYIPQTQPQGYSSNPMQHQQGPQQAPPPPRSQSSRDIIRQEAKLQEMQEEVRRRELRGGIPALNQHRPTGYNTRPNAVGHHPPIGQNIRPTKPLGSTSNLGPGAVLTSTTSTAPTPTPTPTPTPIPALNTSVGAIHPTRQTANVPSYTYADSQYSAYGTHYGKHHQTQHQHPLPPSHQHPQHSHQHQHLHQQQQNSPVNQYGAVLGGKGKVDLARGHGAPSEYGRETMSQEPGRSPYTEQNRQFGGNHQVSQYYPNAGFEGRNGQYSESNNARMQVPSETASTIVTEGPPVRPALPEDGYRESPPPPPPNTSTHPLYNKHADTRYNASMQDPPKGGYYPASGAVQQPRQYQYSATNPWQREEREKEQARRREAARQWRDQQIAELSTLPHRTPQQEEQLRALQLERDFQKRAEEVANQQDDDEESNDLDAESIQRVQGLLRTTTNQERNPPTTEQHPSLSRNNLGNQSVRGSLSQSLGASVQSPSNMVHGISSQNQNPANVASGQVENSSIGMQLLSPQQQSSQTQSAIGQTPLSPSYGSSLSQFGSGQKSYTMGILQTSEDREMQRRIDEVKRKQAEFEEAQKKREEDIRQQQQQLQQQQQQQQQMYKNQQGLHPGMLRLDNLVINGPSTPPMQNGNNEAPPPPERGSSYAVMSQQSALRSNSSTTSSIMTLSAQQTPSIKRVSFHDTNANIDNNQRNPSTGGLSGPASSAMDVIREDPNNFITDAENLLASPKTPEGAGTPFTGTTPGVIGAQEVYKDPRQKRLAEKQKQQQQNSQVGPVPEKLSFKEKMKMFAMETGEDGTPRDKVKISRAQREIDNIGSPLSTTNNHHHQHHHSNNNNNNNNNTNNNNRS